MAKVAKGKAASVAMSPHVHAPQSLHRIMWDVVIALMPATFASIYFFGYNSLRIIGLSVGTALVTEALMCLVTKRRMTVLDGSAVITGLLFAFNLPPNSPWFLVVVGSAFAIAIVKWAFGGLGYNIMNPALGGRIFVLAAWGTYMINNWSPTIRSFVAKGDSMAAASTKILDAVSSASPLNVLKMAYKAGGEGAVQSATNAANAVSSASVHATNMMTSASNWVTNAVTNVSQAVHAAASSAAPVTHYGYTYWNMFAGNIPGCIGETSALALLIGFVYLLVRKVITPTIPVIYIGTVALLAWMFGGLPLHAGWFAGDPLYHILGGGLFLGAIFMATDYVTSPISLKGQVLYAVALGLLTVIIRLWGGYPEGVSYSIVVMNLFVPIIDRYMKPKIYGKSRAKAKEA